MILWSDGAPKLDAKAMSGLKGSMPRRSDAILAPKLFAFNAGMNGMGTALLATLKWKISLKTGLKVTLISPIALNARHE